MHKLNNPKKLNQLNRRVNKLNKSQSAVLVVYLRFLENFRKAGNQTLDQTLDHHRPKWISVELSGTYWHYDSKAPQAMSTINKPNSPPPPGTVNF